MTMGVVLTGYLNKVKKHNRSATERLFIVLTHSAVHWFKRQEGYDLFGEEQNNLKVSEITRCAKSATNPLQFEIESKDKFVRIFEAQTAEEAQHWVSAVNKVHGSLAHGLVRRMSISGVDNTEMLDDPMAYVSKSTVVTVAAVHVDGSGQPTGDEVVLATNCFFEEPTELPHLGPGQKLTVLMSDGGVASCGYEQLRQAAQEGGNISRIVVGSSLAGELDLHVVKKREVELRPTPMEAAQTLFGGNRRVTYSPLGAAEGGSSLSGVLAGLVFVMISRQVYFDSSALALWTLYLLMVLHAAMNAFQARRREPWTVTFVSHRLMAPNEGVESKIPTQFIEGCLRDLQEASRRWEITRTWRKKDGIDGILDEPQPHFNNIKRCYPHFCCGRTRCGNIVYYEQVGHIDLQGLKRMGLSIDALLRHYIFATEYMWRITHPRRDGRVLTIFDVEGVAISDLAGDAKQFLTRSMALVQAHYPERSLKILIVNAPGWFSIIWKAIRGWINEETRKKISILTPAETKGGMLELLDEDNIPEEYGGTMRCGSGQKGSARFYSPQEVDMRRYVAMLNERHGRDETQVDMPPPFGPTDGSAPLGEREMQGRPLVLACDLPEGKLKGAYDVSGKDWIEESPEEERAWAKDIPGALVGGAPAALPMGAATRSTSSGRLHNSRSPSPATTVQKSAVEHKTIDDKLHVGVEGADYDHAVYGRK